MRELEGAGIVHRPDSDYNPRVRDAIRAARIADGPGKLINYMKGAIPDKYMRKDEELER